MPGVSREQINHAKQVNILDYILTHEQNNVKRIGQAHYLIDHDSLRISNGLWMWESQGIGGKNVLDYLIKVRGYNFIDAVKHLTGADSSYMTNTIEVRSQIKLKQPFKLPLRNDNNDRVIKYLRKRGIDQWVIEKHIRLGAIYESVQWHNCVFVGRDDDGKARYATMRGTIGDFKRDADGSDKRFGFISPPINGKGTDVAVFESPIDVLSHITLYPSFSGWRLSLGCTSSAALTAFLERHDDVKSVIICTDNDEAGNRAAKRIAEVQGIRTSRVLPPAGLNDWNDVLMWTKGKIPLKKQLEAAKATAAEHNARSNIKQKSITKERR